MYKVCIEQKFDNHECIVYIIFDNKELQLINIHKNPRRFIPKSYHTYVDAFKIPVINITEHIIYYIKALLNHNAIKTVNIGDRKNDWQLLLDRIENQYKSESPTQLWDGDYEIADENDSENKHREYTLTEKDYLSLEKNTYKPYPSSLVNDICILLLLGYQKDNNCTLIILPSEIIYMIIKHIQKQKNNIYDWLGLI